MSPSPATPIPTQPRQSKVRSRSRSRTRALLCALGLVGLVGLSGCSALSAQNPNSSLRPVNAVALGEDARVMLGGADVVAYFTNGRYQPGLRAHRSQHQGVDFYFASAAHKALFDAQPAAYLPQFGGYCANGIVYGIPWGGNADTWTVIGGKLYLFGGQGSKDAFLLDALGNPALAERYWRDEVAGSNSFLQRAKRLAFKVPHYRSDAELAQAVAAARAQKP